MKKTPYETHLYLIHDRKTVVILREFFSNGTKFTRLFTSSNWFTARDFMNDYATTNNYKWCDTCYVKGGV